MPSPSPRSLKLPLLAAAGLLLAAVYGWRQLRPLPPPPPIPQRDPAPLNELHEVGVLEPRLIERVLTPINGTLAMVAEDGTRVRAGDLLFLIDEEEIRSRIDEQQQAIESRMEELETAQNELAVIINTYAFLQARELAELEHAELELAHRMAGMRAEDRRLHEIAIALAELDLQDREERLERQRELVRQNFAAPATLDLFIREFEAAQSQLTERRTQFELESRPLPEEERLTLEAAVTQARAVVERSEARHAREVGNKTLEIEGIELRIRHARRDLEDREWELEQVRITASEDGILRLMRRLNWRSRVWQPLAVGQQTWSRDVLGELVDPHDLTLRVLIHESDILRVRPGQSATVTLTAYPDQPVPGRVRSLTRLGQDRMDLTPIYRQSPPTRQAHFLAEVSLDPHDLPAMPGMTASVVIQLEEEQP